MYRGLVGDTGSSVCACVGAYIYEDKRRLYISVYSLYIVRIEAANIHHRIIYV